MRRLPWVAALVATMCLPALAQRGAGGGVGRGGGAGAVRSGGAAPAHPAGAPAAGGAAAGRRFGGSPGITVGAPALRPGFSTQFTPHTFGSVSGFGNVVFPGTGHPPGTIIDPTFGPRLANTVNGNTLGGGFRRFGRGPTTVVVPYGVPVYVPYPEQQPYAAYPPAEAAPPQTVIYVIPGAPDRSMTTPAPESSGPMIYTVPPRENGATAPPPPEQRKYFLIALKNSSIYSATDYWLEGDTLHYVTLAGAHNQVSLDQLDLEFTYRLNRDRGLEFRLEK